jgi:hypothetical protein
MDYRNNRFFLGLWIFFAVFFVGMGIWSHMDYEKALDTTRDLRWTVCNTTAFSIDQSTFNGILTIQVEKPSPCIWQQVMFFQCAGPNSEQCIRDNTNRFNNHAWSCVVHVEPSNEAFTNCNILVWSDWPDVEKGYQQGPVQYVFFAFACLLCLIICGMLRWCTFRAPVEDTSHLLR